MNCGDTRENIIVNFPQLQCLVGTSIGNLVNFVKIHHKLIHRTVDCEILMLSIKEWYGIVKTSVMLIYIHNLCILKGSE